MITRLATVSLALLVLPAMALPADEPTVHVLSPGFSARRLPLNLTNVNGLAFAPDGRLFAVGYDGKIRRLVDTDGDGLEDTAEMFWDKNTLISPIQAIWAPEGLYVSSHLKVSLLIDADKDGKADREEVVATGWPNIPSGSGLVDAMGIALDPQNNLFVAIGCADYSNPYLEKDGKSHYDPKSELGAILKVAPDRKSREVFAGGIRFAYALKFNRQGDLFATDQEGETWLPGANPLDELNLIEKGRHYGWPPKHERFLKDSRDEPPVAEFSPQHQSACGMVFDEARPGWQRFGPEAWEGSAIVAGFSRGKVWRVDLVKVPGGYVGRPNVFACVDRMVSDVAISPSGDLYLSAHGGQPDWGTGPSGPGDLFKISYRGSPRPVIAWPTGPLEAKVAFDRPIHPRAAEKIVGATIPYGTFVRAGDRFETIRPPYKAVEAQQAAAKGTLKVASATLADDGRTLVLGTDPIPFRASYAVTVPNVHTEGSKGPGEDADVAFDLSGLEVSWDDGTEGAKPRWSGWWPHLDPWVVRRVAAGSAEHERSLELLKTPGRLTLKGYLALPKGNATLRLRADAAIEDASLGGASGSSSSGSVDLGNETNGEPMELFVTVRTGKAGKPLSLHATYVMADDPTERPVPSARFSVPWAPPAPPESSAPAPVPKEVAGGDATRGEAVFYSEEAKCSTCHAIRGKGGQVGPDLSNLVHKDAASVYRDIAEPSATINPDYVPFTVSTKDGRVLAGVVRAEGKDAIRVLGADAKATVIPRSEVEEIRPSATSIMPVGLPGAIGEARMRDLMAFLTKAPK